jgi:L-lactate dehydrogenase complex protein LldF
VRIPIPSIINRLRYDAVRQDQVTTKGAGKRRYLSEAATWKSWAWAASHPRIYNFSAKTSTRLRGLVPSKLSAWTHVRTAPQIAEHTLHERLQQLGVDYE